MTVAYPEPASETRRNPPPVASVQLPVSAVTQRGAAVPRAALMHARFAFFMSELRDERGDELIVAEHHEEWADLMQFSALLCLLAPRDHGKTYTEISYLLWRAWRHNRDPQTGELLDGLPEGKFQAVLFSETLPQAEIFFDLLQSLALANPDLFGDILPTRTGGAANRGVWSKRRVRFRNGAELIIRGYRTSTRGLHPDLIVLDDVLNEQNTLTSYQRDKGWRYFVGTLMPMNSKQIVVVGTAFHYDDLLHRLKPKPGAAPLVVNNRKVIFRWVRYRAVNWETREVLWAEQHSLDDLLGRRDQDPLIFSREFQNDPRDDSSSLFPWEVTSKAVKAGEALTFVPGYRKSAGEWVLFGADFAMSEAVGADYTVAIVAAVDRQRLTRRVLRAWRLKGVSFRGQVDLLRDICRFYDVDLGVMEQNSFQRWVRDETRLYPETAGRVVGHQTDAKKNTLAEGVPSIKIGLESELWVMPSGDAESREFAHVWQSELQAFGWKDDKLQGVGEHDDTVIATWLLDRAVRLVQRWVDAGPEEETVTGEDLGITPVKIGEDY